MRPDVSKRNKQKRVPVVQLTITGRLIGVFESVTAAAEHIGVTRKQIIRCCRSDNSLSTSKGYRWRYAKDVNLDKLLSERL